jgi:hypothetical protein
MDTINETGAVAPRRLPWNKGKLIGPATQTRLGHSDALTACRAHAGPGALQSSDRQQAARLRRGEPQGSRRRATWLCDRPCDRSAKQDRCSGQVRDYRADAPGDRRAPCHPEASRRFPVPGSTRQRPLPHHPAIRPPAVGMDRQNRSCPVLVRHAFAAANQATLIYRRTGNLRAVQLLLGHTKVESTVRYLGIEVDDALAIAEQIDV